MTTIVAAPAPASAAVSSAAAHGDDSTILTSPATSPSSSSYVPLLTTAQNMVNTIKSSNPVLRYGVERLEAISTTALSYVPQPVSNKVQEYGTPLVNAVDSRLQYAYDRLHPVATNVATNVAERAGQVRQTVNSNIDALAHNAWLKKADSVLASITGFSASSLVALGVKGVNGKPVQSTELVPMFNSFYVCASHQFLVMQRSPSASSSSSSSSSSTTLRDAFVDALRARMHHIWNAGLVEPSGAFFDTASALYAEHRGESEHWTTKELMDQVRPVLGDSWVITVTNSIGTSLTRPAELLYAVALQQYLALRDRATAAGQQGRVVSSEFIASMKERLGQTWHDSLEAPLAELYSSFSDSAASAVELTKTQTKAARGVVLDSWQSFLLLTMHAFDRVLPPVGGAVGSVSPFDAENAYGSLPDDTANAEQSASSSSSSASTSTPMDDDTADDLPSSLTLGGLASHVNGRVRERGVVANITTASTNVVTTTVSTAQGLAKPLVSASSNAVKSAVSVSSNAVNSAVSTAVTTASVLAKPIVVPVVTRVAPLVEPVVSHIKSVQDQATPVVQSAYARVQVQVEQAYTHVKTNVDSVQTLLQALASQTTTSLKAVAESTVNTTYSTTVTTLTTLHSALPSPVQTRLNDLQASLHQVVEYAKHVQQGGQEYVLEHRVTKLSKDLLASLSSQVSSVQHGLLTLSQEQTAALLQRLDDAKSSAVELVVWTRKLALEQQQEQEQQEQQEQEAASEVAVEEGGAAAAAANGIAN